MNRICHFFSAAVIASGLQLSAAFAQAPTSNELYHAPSWWIGAFAQGNLDILQTGDKDLARRMSMWVVGFANGLGSTCGQPERSAQPTRIYMQGVADGRRFAAIRGCSSAEAQMA